MVEENAGANKLIMQKVSKGMTIHIPAGEHPCPLRVLPLNLPLDAPCLLSPWPGL